jgi:hypothetical protein
LLNIARAVFGVVVGLVAGTAFAYVTANAAHSTRTMFITQGVILALVAAVGIYRTRLRGFGFVEGALFGAVAAILVCWILLILVVGASP